jgi:S1-C subfamily serine protease
MRNQRLRILVSSAALLSMLPRPTSAQTASAAEQLVVAVRAEFRCPGSIGSTAASGSATAVRISGDTLYAVTATHVVTLSGCELKSAGGRFQERSGPVEVLAMHPKLDLALLRIPLAGKEPLQVPRLPSPVVDPYLAIPGGFQDESAFVLGCPESVTCFEKPIEARIRFSMPPFLRLQIPFIEGGYSGGPVVRKNGAIIGIVVAASGDAIQCVRWAEVGPWLAEEGAPYSLPEPSALPPGRTSIVIGVALAGQTAREFGGHPVRAYFFAQQTVGTTVIWAGVLNINDTWHQRCSECSGVATLLATRGFAGGGGIAFRSGALSYLESGNDPVLFELRLGGLAAVVDGLVEQQIADSINPESGSPSTQRFLSKREVNFGGLADATFIFRLKNQVSLYIGGRVVSYGEVDTPSRRVLSRSSLISGLGLRL